MASIGIINEEGVEVERQIKSRKATVQTESFGTFNPSVTQRVKFDNKGQMSSITTECGETENRREAENLPTVTVEGIIVEEEIEEMRQLKNQEEITFVSDIFSGTVTVQRLSITQESDLLYYQPDGGGKQLAFSFQIQLKETE